MKLIFKLLLLLLLCGGSGSYTRLEKVSANLQASLRRIKEPFVVWSIEGVNFDRIALKHIEAKHPKVPIWYIRATVREPQLIIKLNGNWKYYRRLLDSDKYLCVVLYMKYGKGRVKTAYIVEKP